VAPQRVHTVAGQQAGRDEHEKLQDAAVRQTRSQVSETTEEAQGKQNDAVESGSAQYVKLIGILLQPHDLVFAIEQK